MKQLAIPLGCQRTSTKWLVISSILWVKQLAIRLGCKRPQPSRWLSRKRGERSGGGEARRTNRCASFTLTIQVARSGRSSSSAIDTALSGKPCNSQPDSRHSRHVRQTLSAKLPNALHQYQTNADSALGVQRTLSRASDRRFSRCMLISVMRIVRNHDSLHFWRAGNLVLIRSHLHHKNAMPPH